MGLEQYILDVEETIEELPINPSGSYTAEELRDILDGRAEDKEIREAINEIIKLLLGVGGAATIGTETGGSVQAKLDDIKNTLSQLENDKANVETVKVAQENITAVIQALDNKVDKVSGKMLSTNDFTDAEKEKLGGIEEGAQKNTVFLVAGKEGYVELEIGDISGLPDFMDSSIAGNAGVHGLRYYNGALEVFSDGAWVSATAKLEGDIETALDEIIAIQESLIGGASA